MYHRFNDPTGGGVNGDVLETQIAYIARHFVPLTLGKLLDYLHAGEQPPAHTLVLTVDDGHRDFLEVAYPVLQRHGVPATLFVATGFIDGELWLWPDQVTWLLDQCRERPATVRIAGTSLELGNNAWQTIIDHVLTLPDAHRRQAPTELATELESSLPAAPPMGYQPITWSELRSLETNGIEIGGHTHTHPSLGRVPVDRLHEEIHYCRQRLDEELGPRPRPFCYPNGQPDDVTPAVRATVSGAGFTGAVVAYADEAVHNDPYQLRRHSSSADMFQFYKASTGLEWLGRQWQRRPSL
jgi:peptidoglycan/xylan/chitin deacetylase (PgdA/CDA1 family)